MTIQDTIGTGEYDRLPDSPLIYEILPQEDVDQLYRMYPGLAKSHHFGCPSCGKNLGPVVDGIVNLDGIWWQCNCRDQLQRHKHYLNAGIGDVYQFLSWNDFHGDQAAKDAALAYDKDIDDYVSSGVGLFIWGESNGTGKTFIANQIVKDCVMQGYACYSTTFADMLSNMKAGWKDEEFAGWYKKKVDAAQVLLIDDVGKEIMQTSGFNNSFAQQTLDSLLRTRAQQNRVTFITTNLAAGDFKSLYGVAATSILSETTKIIHVTGNDYRPSAKTNKVGERRIW